MCDTYDLESKIGEQVKLQLEAAKKTLAEALKDIVWQACNDYVEYAEFEPLNNWKDRTRADLVAQRYYAHTDSIWGRSQRDKIFEEHRDELVPLIRTDRIEALEKEVVSLQDRLDFEIRLNRDRR